MNIFISGSSSNLGSAVVESFVTLGHTLFSHSLSAPAAKDLHSQLYKITGGKKIDIVMLLEGEDIFSPFQSRKNLRRQSEHQLEKYKEICNYFTNQAEKPECIAVSSSCLYYGSNSLEPVIEKSSRGSDFAACYFNEVEKITDAAGKFGIRCVQLRLGKVVSRLATPSLPRLPFMRSSIARLPADNKRQISWVSRQDAVRALRFIFENETLSGPINIVSGDTVTKDEFNTIIAGHFGLRRTIPFPAILLKTLFGVEAESFFQASYRAIPLKLMESGFLFKDISLEEYTNLDSSPAENNWDQPVIKRNASS